MPNNRQPDDADMPPCVVDVQQPFARIRIWHAPHSLHAYLGISEPEYDAAVCVDVAALDAVMRAWAAHRESEATHAN
jgi:hypothetical protein